MEALAKLDGILDAETMAILKNEKSPSKLIAKLREARSRIPDQDP